MEGRSSSQTQGGWAPCSTSPGLGRGSSGSKTALAFTYVYLQDPRAVVRVRHRSVPDQPGTGCGQCRCGRQQRGGESTSGVVTIRVSGLSFSLLYFRGGAEGLGEWSLELVCAGSNPVLPPTRCRVFGKLLNLPVPQFLPL